MNTALPRKPDDDDLDRLLERGYRDTSPEFEARWVALKRELRQRPAPRLRWLAAGRLTGWLGAMGAVAVIAFIFFAVRPPAPPAPELTPQLRELLTLDAALAHAQPLLDDETRAALLHLPATGQPQN